MFAKVKTYAIYILLASSITLGGASVYLLKRNSHLSSELNKVTTAYEKAQDNLSLVTDQLKEETRTREAAEATLDNLRSIPDADYNQELPASVRSVLDDFHSRMR